MTRRFLFLTSSARPEGNALLLARAAAARVSDPCRWIDLTDPPLPPYRDLRPGHQMPQGPLDDILQAMRAATDIVFVAPIYWYALPAPAKLLLDHWSGWLDAPQTGFADWAKGKRIHLITARADPDPSVPDLTEAMLQRSIEWLGMDWAGSLHGIGEAPGDILNDHAAMAAAQWFLASPEGA